MLKWIKQHDSEIVQILVLFAWSAVILSFELWVKEDLDSAAWLVMGMVGGTVLSEIFHRIREDRTERRRATYFLKALGHEVRLAEQIANGYARKNLEQAISIPTDAARMVFRGERDLPDMLPHLVKHFLAAAQLINARVARINGHTDGYVASPTLVAQQKADLSRLSEKALLPTTQQLLAWLKSEAKIDLSGTMSQEFFFNVAAPTLQQIIEYEDEARSSD